jgi:hypothetical protein
MPEIAIRILFKILEKGAILAWPAMALILLIMPFGLPIMAAIIYIRNRRK